MILRVSSVIDRQRRAVLLAAAVAGAGTVAGAVRAPAEPTTVLVTTLLVAALFLAAGAVLGVVVRRPGSPQLEVDPAGPAFRPPRHATAVFAVLFLMAGTAFVAGTGGWSWAQGDRDGGWLLVMLLLGVPTLLLATAAWRGTGLVLTPDGIRAEHVTGTVTVPWTALAPTQPEPAPEHLDLVLARPGQLTRTGLVRRPARLTFGGTPPAFAAAVVRHYAAHPADRPLIGTPAELERLAGLLATPPALAAPPPSRRHVAILAATGVLVFAAAVAGDTWAGVTTGGTGVLSHVADAVHSLLILVSFHCLVAAVRGVRARRRPPPYAEPPAPPPPPPAAVPASRPAWARDVTRPL